MDIINTKLKKNNYKNQFNYNHIINNSIIRKQCKIYYQNFHLIVMYNINKYIKM